jgi:hypothetical protein
MKETNPQKYYLGIDPISNTSSTYTYTTSSDNVYLGQKPYDDNGFIWTTSTTTSPAIISSGYNSISIPTYPADKFECFVTSEGRITEAKRDALYKLLDKTTQDYFTLVRYLNIPEKLFNTVVLEYALKYKVRLYMELIAFKQNYSKIDLFNAVVKFYGKGS